MLAGLRGALRDTTIATVAMAVAVMGARHLTSRCGDLVGLALAVGTGTTVYLIAARLLHIEMLSLFTGKGRLTSDLSGDRNL